MTDDNLDAAINDSFRQHKRGLILENLADRLHLTLEQVTKLTAHPDHGALVKEITLRELVDEVNKKGGKKGGKKGSQKAKNSAKGGKKIAKSSSKKAAKPPKKKAAKKKAAKKKAAKKKAAKKTAKKGPKADKGRPKPRLDYETGMREVLSALQATGQPTGRQAIENATGYTGVQVRTFCKRLATEGKVKILGEGGRSTRYQAV